MARAEPRVPMRMPEPFLFPELPVAFMNADHAAESRLLGDLSAALEAHGRGEVTLGAVLERPALLAVRTRESFVREEAAMREARFPGVAAHQAEHDRALAEMDAEARRFRERGDTGRLSTYLFETVPAWYREHVEFPFFMQHLKDKTLEPVAVATMFETGTNRWRSFDAWPPAGTKQAMYLGANGTLSTTAPGDTEAFDQYVSDPNRPVPYVGHVQMGMQGDYMTEDQRFAPLVSERAIDLKRLLE